MMAAVRAAAAGVPVVSVARGRLWRLPFATLGDDELARLRALLPAYAAPVSRTDYRHHAVYVMDAATVAAMAALTTDMAARCLAAARALARDDAALASIGVPAYVRSVLRSAEGAAALEAAPVMGRFDWVLGGYGTGAGDDAATFVPRLLEYNGDTAGTLIESTLVPALYDDVVLPALVADGRLPRAAAPCLAGGATTGRALRAALAAAYAERLAGAAGVTVAHHYGEDYLVNAAHALQALLTDAGVPHVTRAVYPDMPPPDAPGVVLKLYRWSRVLGTAPDASASAFPPIKAWLLRHGLTRILEPLLAYLLQHKGLLTFFPPHPNALVTVAVGAADADADADAVLTGAQLAAAADSVPHAATDGAFFKPFTGINATGVAYLPPAALTPAATAGDGALPRLTAGILQQLEPVRPVPLPPATGGVVHPILSTWVVNGVYAGMLVRESRTPVTVNEWCTPLVCAAPGAPPPPLAATSFGGAAAAAAAGAAPA